MSAAEMHSTGESRRQANHYLVMEYLVHADEHKVTCPEAWPVRPLETWTASGRPSTERSHAYAVYNEHG